MVRRVLALVSLVALPLLARAQGTERYLPPGSQIVLQIDPFQKTKAAYERTVQGKMMLGDTGKALKAFYAWAIAAGEAAAEMHEMPTKEDVALIKDGLKLIERVTDEGLALGIEINQVWPLEGRLVVVLPKLAAGQPSLAKFIDDVRAKAQNAGAPGEIKDANIAGRNVRSAQLPFVSVDWWAEQDDFILTFGSSSSADYIKQIDAKKTGLAQNLTYKKLLEVGDFPTRTRGYVDVPSLTKLADKHSEEASKTVNELGLRGMGPILTISGFDGPALRTLTEIETLGARKGFVSMMSPKKISLADLPPMPSDLTTFSAINSNSGEVYASLIDIAEKVGRIYVPDQVDNIKAGLKGFEDIIAIDLKKDLFDSFDNVYVQYSSPSEGIMGMGGVSLFKVKDEAKLKKSLKNLVGALPNIPGFAGGLKTRTYRGVEIFEFHTNTLGSFTVQSLAVHKGYLAYGSYPQQVQGYILRADGVLPVWKADERLTKALSAFPKEFASVSVSDPRPTIEAMIAGAPTVISVLNGFTNLLPGLQPFDISLIPHAQEATLGVFPNVSMSTDDGKKIRYDSRASVGR